MARIEMNIDLNRVEGDLEIRLSVQDGVIAEARMVGTLYRGFEQILIGRDPRDALVITPRVCGICGTSHLYSAVLALESAWQISPPPNAVRIRNLCLQAEGLQSDIRQTFLYFTPDLCNPKYQDLDAYEDILAAFEPFKGTIYLQALEVSRRATQIVAELGGQWPHSSFMLPGGVTAAPDIRKLIACKAAIDAVKAWYEQKILGCGLAQFMALSDGDEFFNWLATKNVETSGLGLMSGFMHNLQLHECGVGTGYLLSYGTCIEPDSESVMQGKIPSHRVKPGFYDPAESTISALDHQLINEHVRYSWYYPYQGGKHPWMGETIPDYQPDSDRYTWSKAPRYAEKCVQTGPLAELAIGGDALMQSLLRKVKNSAWLRQFARVRRIGAGLILAADMIDELMQHLGELHFNPVEGLPSEGQGYGMVMAARGALGHWIQIREGKIERYQIITPTAWNASPRDSNGQPGHWEQSLVGLEITDEADTAEIGHVIRSHDPCLVCTVHMVGDVDHRFTVPV